MALSQLTFSQTFPAAGPHNTTNATTPRSFNVTATGVTSMTIELWGAGGSASNLPNGEVSSGGGGGGYTKAVITGLTGGETITATIGASNATGAAGGNTTLTVNGITYTANGGQAGTTIALGGGGAGGAAVTPTGFIVSSYAGGKGGNGNASSSGGGGGGSAFDYVKGNDGYDGGTVVSVRALGGTGTGAGGYGAAINNDAAAAPNSSPGVTPGGGGGGRSSGGTYGTVKEGAAGRIIISAVQYRPVAAPDTGTTLAEDGGSRIITNVIANDTDANGNPTLPLNASGRFYVDLEPNTYGGETVETTFHNSMGLWVLNTTTGDVTFTPDANYTGTATLPYRLYDSTSIVTGGIIAGSYSDATITVIVTAVSDAPRAYFDMGSVALLKNGANGTVNVITNDIDPDGAITTPLVANGLAPGAGGLYAVDLQIGSTATIETTANYNGTWTLDNTTGIVTYDPEADFTGVSYLNYTLYDPQGNSSTNTISFTVINDTDSDNVVYTTDLDDDNDGITDSEECGASTAETNVTGNLLPASPVTPASFLTGLVLSGADIYDIQLNDVLLRSNAITYNGTSYDAVIKITGRNIPTGKFIGTSFAFENVVPYENPYITYTLTLVESGSATAGNPDGTPVTVKGLKMILSDIDGENSGDTRDVNGYSTALTPEQIVMGIGIENKGMLSNIPTGYNEFRPIGIVNDTTNGLPDYSVTALFGSYSTGSFMAGVTGTKSAVSTRTQWLRINCLQSCDHDKDSVADQIDLDSDNDGIPDIVEAGFQTLSINKSTMISPTDANLNGLSDTIDGYISGGTYSILYLPDTDGDGIRNHLDLDSDNDSLFDIDEADIDTYYVSNTGTYYNGDGDVDGDGVNELADTDGDGIQNLNDDLPAAFGTTNKVYPVDTDVDGIQNYLDVRSNGSTDDIDGTFYSNLDTDNNGIIDGTPTVNDEDGIHLNFDTNDAAYGSPRDLSSKYLLEFDGRNDYAEGTNHLTGLTTSTLMSWLKLDTNFSTTGIIVGQDNFYISINASRQLVVTAKSTGLTFTTTALDLNRWYHVAAVYNGADATGYLRLYLNGKVEVSSTSGTYSGNLGSSIQKLTIGRTAGTSSNYFRGFIDEVRVFDSALSADQIQKMVYQEIDANGSLIRGTIIPKDIELSTWASLKAYFRMDTYKDDVIDDYKIAGIDDGVSTTFTRIYNSKYIKLQSAPMPFQTIADGAIEAVVTPAGSFINGADVNTYDWSIVKVDHNVTSNTDRGDLGLFVSAGKTYSATTDNKIQNDWYLKLDGKIDLVGKSQLLQTSNSDLEATTTGFIERDQNGQSNIYNYNYWSSPVSTITGITNNGYKVTDVMKDGTSTTPQNINWVGGYDGSAGAPINLARYWLHTFESKPDAYANWVQITENDALRAGQGYTLKGSGAGTATQNYTFLGKPNNGTITSNSVTADELLLVGNPYPSALDSYTFINDNFNSVDRLQEVSLDGTLYFWEHSSTNNSHYLASYLGGYGVLNLTGGLSPVVPSLISGLGASSKVPNRYIPVGQGFFVYGKTGGGGQVIFNNAQRAFVKEDNGTSNTLFKMSASKNNKTANSQSVEKKNTYKKIRLGFNSNNGYHRQILLGFMNEKATSNIDYGYDGLNMDDYPNDMYFLNGKNQLVIQGEGYYDENASFPIGVKTETEGKVSFIVDEMENFDTQQTIFIYDKETNTYHDLKSGKYEVNLPAGVNETRFAMRFSDKNLNLTQHSISDITIAHRKDENTISIQNKLENITVEKLTLFNILGQSIDTWKIENQEQLNIQIPIKKISSGVYIIKIKTSEGEISKKIIVH